MVITEENNNDNRERIDLFISILISILESKIKFPRTKEQPLLPNQTLMQPNKFKTIFIQFLNHFNVQFDANNVSPTRLNKVYKNDKQRSNKISKLFIDSLYQIKNKMESIENDNKFILFTQEVASKMNKKIASALNNNASNNNRSRNRRSGRNYHIQTPKDFNNKRVKSQSRFFTQQQEHDDMDQDNDDDDTMSSANTSINESIETKSDVSSQYSDHNNNNPQSPNQTNIYLPQYENSQNQKSINMNISTGLKIQPLYSVMVPLSNNNAIEYQFLSFNPLFVKQNVLSSQL